MKDLGVAKFLLGLEIRMCNKSKLLAISQQKYIKDLIYTFEEHLGNLKSADNIPMSPSCKLSKTHSPVIGSQEWKQMQKYPYREAVGGLMYLACATRPDISHAVGEVARYVSNPGLPHWKAVTQIFSYLKCTSDYALHFDGTKTGYGDQIVGYSDADWGGDLDTRRSKTGYIVIMFGGVVSWRSKLQTCVSLSTLEAELVAANEAGRELLHTRGLVKDLGYTQRTTTLFEDNQPCIATTKDPIINDRVKLIDIKYHWIRKEVADGSLQLIYCKTADMVADILTKALPVLPFTRLRSKLGLFKIGSFSGRLLE
jgi:hypothetical protein